MAPRTARLLGVGFAIACLIVLAPLLRPSRPTPPRAAERISLPPQAIRTPAPTPVPLEDLPLAPADATKTPTGRWLLCVSVDQADELDTGGGIASIGGSIGTTVVLQPLLSLRYNSSAQGASRVKEAAQSAGATVLTPASRAFAGVAAAFSACSSHATKYDGVVFCEARHCPTQDIADVIGAAASGVAMNRRHTVFAAVSRVVATLGVFEENLFPAIDGLAVDYAIRWHLTEPKATTKLLMRKVRRIAHRRRAKTIHDLVANIGHPPSLMSAADLDRRERCSAGHVLGTKYLSKRMKLVNGGGYLALIQTPLPPDLPFRSCVMTGNGVRRHLCGERRHCILDGFLPGLTGVEKQLQKVSAIVPKHKLRFGWQHVLAARIGFLLKLAQDQPWREDIVHGVVMTVTPKDIAAMKDTVLTYDAPIKMFTILLSGHSERLAQDLRSVANMVDQDGVGDKFRFFYEAGGVRDIDGWNGQTQHIFREDPTSQWVWVTDPTVSLWPSYLACFAKDTTSVQSTHSYSRLHVRPQSMAIMRSSSDRLAAITKAPNSVSELDRSLCAVCRWDHCVVDPEESPRADCDAADAPVRGGGWTNDLPCCHAHHLYRSD